MPSAEEVFKILSVDEKFIARVKTSIDSIMSPEPFNSEGDYQMASVTFTYNYSRKTGANGRF